MKLLQWIRRDAILSVVLCSVCGLAPAQTFPSKPIKIVVPNAAGGAADITARTVGQKLSDALGQAVVIDNKPSAGGVVAGELVAKSDADGHTLLLISSGTAVSAALFKQLPFDTLRDFAPVSKLASFDLVIAVAENSRFKSRPTCSHLLALIQVSSISEHLKWAPPKTWPQSCLKPVQVLIFKRCHLTEHPQSLMLCVVATLTRW